MPKLSQPKQWEPEPYQFFMRPEPRENLGPVRLEYDKIFGKRVKVRSARIGMVRNAASKNRKEVKIYLEPFPHIRIAQAKPLQGWYKGKHERNQVRPRPCYTEALLTEPYGGYCPVRCIHCYINSGIRGYRGTGLVTVPINYGEQIASQLSKIRRGSAGYITSFHDPFNVLESVYHNSQRVAEEFVRVGLPVFFLSRLNYPTWAINLLRRNVHSYAQKSINTSNQADWKKMSPGAPSLEEQFRDIRRLKKHGVYVSIQVNPIVPGVTSHAEIIQLLKLLERAGADHIIVKFTESGYPWVPTMVKRMVAKFGDRGKRFAALFTQNIGGVRTIDEDYRLQAHELYSRHAKRCGLTYSVCYEYRYERDSSSAVVDKTGISIGPEVTTSDQCHGHRVPMYTRNTADEQFKPIKACPRSGCLYCADDNDGEPRCRDITAGEAIALRMVDLRKPIEV